MSEAVRARKGPGRWVPEAPAAPLRWQAWKAIDLVSLHSTISDDPPHRAVWFGLVPVQGGRIVMSGARCLSVGLRGRDRAEAVMVGPRPQDPLDAPIPDETAELLRGTLDRRYLVAWSAGTEAALLEEIFGEGRMRWLQRTVDVRRLAFLADRLSERDPDPDALDLASVARRYRVPGPPPCDALDAAVMTAELFLVLATKLAALGYRDVGSLLRQTWSASVPKEGGRRRHRRP